MFLLDKDTPLGLKTSTVALEYHEQYNTTKTLNKIFFIVVEELKKNNVLYLI